LMQQVAVTLSGSCTNHSILSRSCLLFTFSLNASRTSDAKCLPRIYLAMLYCHLGHHKMAAELCASSAKANCFRRCVKVVKGSLLPTFDRDITIVLGSVPLYHHVTNKCQYSTVRRQRVIERLRNVFSVEVVAQFLEVKFRLNDRNRSHRKRLKLYDVGDYLLIYITLRSADGTTYSIHNQQPAITINSNTCSLESQLIGVAVENLTSFRCFLSREFSSVCTVVSTDVEALHAYKLGFYEHCLQLSQQNVHSLRSRNEFHHVLLTPFLADYVALADRTVEFDSIFQRSSSIN
jgi:hypothetical protein